MTVRDLTAFIYLISPANYSMTFEIKLENVLTQNKLKEI